MLWRVAYNLVAVHGSVHGRLLKPSAQVVHRLLTLKMGATTSKP